MYENFLFYLPLFSSLLTKPTVGRYALENLQNSTGVNFTAGNQILGALRVVRIFISIFSFNETIIQANADTQHHDAITGTSVQAVVNDYLTSLNNGITNAMQV